jgi:hypothetical protein
MEGADFSPARGKSQNLYDRKKRGKAEILKCCKAEMGKLWRDYGWKSPVGQAAKAVHLGAL